MVLSARRHAGPPAPAAPVTGGMGAGSRVATAVNATMQISNAPDEARAAAGAGGPEAARGARRARVLLVDTSTTGQTGSGTVWDEVVDYTACADPDLLASHDEVPASRLVQFKAVARSAPRGRHGASRSRARRARVQPGHC